MYNVHRIVLTEELKQKLDAAEAPPREGYGDVYDITLYKSNRIDAQTLIGMTATYNPKRRNLRLFYRLPTVVGVRLYYLGDMHIAPGMPIVDRCWSDSTLAENNPDFQALFATAYLRQIRNDAITDLLAHY